MQDDIQRNDAPGRPGEGAHEEDTAEGALAATPPPPYYAVLFTRVRAPVDEGYDAEAERMWTLAREQPGYLGVESVSGEGGLGITISYWSSLEAIAAWKQNAEHLLAQAKGKSTWYERYEIRVARVERAYSFRRPR